MVGLDSVVVGEKIVQGMVADAAIMDTGTSLITASAADAAAINQVTISISAVLQYRPFLQCRTYNRACQVTLLAAWRMHLLLEL